MMEITRKEIHYQGRATISVRSILMALVLTFLIIFPSPTSVYGQGSGDPVIPPDSPPEEHRFDNLTIEDGLSQNSVFAILQGKLGSMWFGTWDGSNRYDGYVFQVNKDEGDTPPPPKTLKFTHLPSEGGLSGSQVRSLFQDSQGVMWIGTSDSGLHKYDGYEITVYAYDLHNPSSLGHNSVWCIHEDPSGMMWIGTLGGLYQFDRTTEKFTYFPVDPNDPDNSLFIFDIIQDAQGLFWIATNRGLEHFDSHTGEFVVYVPYPDDPDKKGNIIRNLYYDQDTNLLWLGARHSGLKRFDPATKTFTHYEPDPDTPNSLSNGTVEHIIKDRTGNFWISTRDKLNRFNPDTEIFTWYQHDPHDPTSLSHNNTRQLYEDRSGKIWVATKEGLSIFDPATEKFTRYYHNSEDPFSINSNNIVKILEDRTGGLWISSDLPKINRLAGEPEKFRTYQHNPEDADSLSNNQTTSIFVDSAGFVWVGTNDGLNRFDPETETFFRYQSDPEDAGSLRDDHIVTIFEDQNGLLWLGTLTSGLTRFDGEEFTYYLNNPDNADSINGNRVSAIFQDDAGLFWVGIHAIGLDRFDGKNFAHYLHRAGDPSSLIDPYVFAIRQGQDDTVWLATNNGGLERLDPATGTFTHYQYDSNNPNSLSSNQVRDIFIDPAGILWIATEIGFNLFDPADETFTPYYEQDGLPGNSVQCILQDDDGLLWLSTNMGLSRFDPENGTFRNYDVLDGLQGNIFLSGVCAKAPDGQLFFGGANGLNAFYPEELVDNPNAPPVILTGFELFNQPVEMGGEDSPLQQAINFTDDITLNYDQSMFTFEFAALNYTIPEKNQYAYKMEGFDDEWWYTTSDRRIATYTNLNPGKYIFRVIGSNNDGVWNEEGTSINITITPPWWGTWWFRGGSLLLILGLVGGGFVWQRDRSRRREEELEATVVERTHELGERVKELQCLYAISRLASKQGATIEEILAGTVDLLPDPFQYPGIACARIMLDDQEFKTDCYQETPWSLLAAITVQGVQAGIVEVRYLEERPNVGEGPFQEEERQLLDAVAERLAGIVQQKQIEKALQAQEVLLNDIFKTNLDTLEIFDPETMRYIMWNQAVNEITGFSDEEIAEMDPLRDFIEEPELSETLAALKKTLDEGEAATRTVVISKDGSQTPMDYRTSLTRDEKGSPVHVIAIGRDISDQLRLEEALQQSEALYRELVENISEVIYASDDKGVIAFISPAIESFLGFTPDQVIGEPFTTFLFHEDIERIEENFEKLMRGETPGPKEYRVVNNSGEIRWMRVSSLPIMDADRVTGFQGVLTDITAVKQAEEQLERVAQLAERQRLARELHDSVTQTLYGIDLFSNATTQALSAGNTKEAIENAQQIQELSQNALGDMRLLIYELRPQILEEEGLVAALRDRLDLVEARTGFNTNIRVVDERPLDPSVEVELYAIATEALNNALKHSSAEQVSVILEYKKDSVCITIRDDGIGFDQSAPDLTKGFGLRNMEERTSRIGGSFLLDSSPGAGVTIKVEVAA